MEGPGAGALSGAEKEKLREKLALLRREYSETVSRLRRARRAERARSHGWGGPEGGGRRQPSPSGSRDNLSPSADKHETSQLQTKPYSDLDTEKKTSVRCEHVPEFFSKEGGQQDSSGAGSTQDSQEGLCCGSVRPAPEGKKTQTSRSLMKLRRRTKAPVLEERESVCDVHLTKADGMVTTARAEELRSPVFRRSSLLDTEENAQTAPRAALVWREDNRLTPPDAAFGVVQGVLEDSVLPGVPELSPCALRDSSCVWQPKSPGAAAMSDNPEPAQLCLENSDSVLLDTSDNGGKESPRITQQVDGESVCEDQGELRRLLDFMSENEVLPADGINTETNEGKSCEGNQSDTNSFPADLALGSVEELMENQQLETQSRLSPPEKVTAPESALNSCTMVEGLLFPVEYYVRTTRRMSNCQRKVDLEAVILSQLGRSKKGQRSKCKQKDANSDRSSQEIAENGVESGVMPFPFLGAENDASSPQQSPPASSGSSTSLGSVSQSSITSTRRDLRRRQRRRKGRGSGCSPGQRGSQELGLSSGLMMPGERSCPLSNVCQGENESCDLGRAPSDESRLSAAAALGSGKTNVPSAVQPASAGPAPGGSQVLGKRPKTLLEQAQNPLQSSHSLTPGNETLPGHVGDLEANLHAEIQPVHRAHRDEQLPVINVPLRRSLRSSARHRDSPASPGAAASPDESRRGRSHPAASEGPASPGLPATDLNTCSSHLPFRSLQWLAPTLGVRDFHLPDEEFGLLKLEKLASSPVNDLEVFVPSVFGDDAASEDEPDAQMDPEGKRLTSNLLLPLKTGWPKLPHGESPASKRELPTHELLFTPIGSVLAAAPLQPESQISEPIFPVVGATPAVPLSGHSELCPSLQPSLPSSQGASVPALQDRECKASALAQHWDSCGAGSAREEEKQRPTLPLEAEGGPNNQPSEAVALEKHQQSESKEQRSCRASPEQKTAGAGQLTPALLDGLREESLQLVSKLKDSSSSCAVDVSTMWWGAAGSKELCVVTACESSVSLWKPLASDHWEKLHTWQLGEIPVIQIVPLPDTCNLVCVALGDLEIGEVRLLLYSTENDSFKQSLVKAGNIKAVLGLQERRLVSSCRTGQEQQVEMVSLAETGRSKDGQTLMPPEETVLAFAEVEGMREALVGTTAVNSIVVWNLKTGQLLKKMHVGCSYLASICHRAYSDSGLLFVVLSHPHAKESESCGSPAFRLVAFNPRTARSAGVLCSSLPPGQAGRYLEGDVQDTSAVAVLTSGAIAVWDLLLGHCTALLPPGPQGSWALARWATTSACLLAGLRDGTVCLYRYRQPQPGVA